MHYKHRSLKCEYRDCASMQPENNMAHKQTTFLGYSKDILEEAFVSYPKTLKKTKKHHTMFQFHLILFHN